MICKPFNINPIQVYASTSEKKYDMKVENLYDLIDFTMKTLETDSVIILKDFNAKISQGPRTDIVGSFGLGSFNERGNRLSEFCRNSGMIIAITFLI